MPTIEQIIRPRTAQSNGITGRDLQIPGRHIPATDAQKYTDDPTDFAEQNRLHDKLHQDVPFLRAHGPADTDLACPFRDGN